MRATSKTTAPSGNEWLPNTVNNLIAAGSTQGTATAIPAGQDLSIFTTVAAGTGAILPTSGVSVPEEYEVANHGANALLIYPPVGGQVGNAGVNTAYSLAAGKTGRFRLVGTKTWTANP